MNVVTHSKVSAFEQSHRSYQINISYRSHFKPLVCYSEILTAVEYCMILIKDFITKSTNYWAHKLYQTFSVIFNPSKYPSK